MKTNVHEVDTDLPSIEDALSQPSVALMLCRSAQDADDKSSRQRARRKAAVIYAAASACDSDFGKWRELVKRINAEKITKRKVRRDKHANRKFEICARVVYRFTHTYDRAYKISRALDYISLKMIKADGVEKYIEENGEIEGIYKRAVKELPRKGLKDTEKQRYRDMVGNGTSYFADIFSDFRSEEKTTRFATKIYPNRLGGKGVDKDKLLTESPSEKS